MIFLFSHWVFYVVIAYIVFCSIIIHHSSPLYFMKHPLSPPPPLVSLSLFLSRSPCVCPYISSSSSSSSYTFYCSFTLFIYINFFRKKKPFNLIKHGLDAFISSSFYFPFFLHTHSFYPFLVILFFFEVTQYQTEKRKKNKRKRERQRQKQNKTLQTLSFGS